MSINIHGSTIHSALAFSGATCAANAADGKLGRVTYQLSSLYDLAATVLLVDNLGSWVAKLATFDGLGMCRTQSNAFRCTVDGTPHRTYSTTTCGLGIGVNNLYNLTNYAKIRAKQLSSSADIVQMSPTMKTTSFEYILLRKLRFSATPLTGENFLLRFT